MPSGGRTLLGLLRRSLSDAERATVQTTVSVLSSRAGQVGRSSPEMPTPALLQFVTSLKQPSASEREAADCSMSPQRRRTAWSRTRARPTTDQEKQRKLLRGSGRVNGSSGLVKYRINERVDTSEVTAEKMVVSD